MNIPILVVSCDAYQDVWHPFFHLFFKHWSDCPYPVYLVSNTVKYPDSRVTSILVGADVDYSSNLIKALEQIPDEWLIFWVDDRPPVISVDTHRLSKLIKLAQAKDAGYLKLIPCNPPALVKSDEEIGEIPKGSRYRVSMTVALWKKSTLLKILQSGETAWDIEKRGGIERASKIDDKFYALPVDTCVHPPLLDIHLISKRELIWRGSKILKQEGLLDYLQHRRSTSFWRNLYIELYEVVWNTYYQLRWQLKRFNME
ncbi:hypothetical protein CAL7716_043260 [Calothrix sp. PCC 7716]|nr:hypothetical protein CAL7716_043260 [Calothrix sp. PCC 7716]